MRRPKVPKGVVFAVAITVVATTASGCLNGGDPGPKPVSNWTIKDARRFDEFPLYWLDQSYDGLPLTLVNRDIDGDGMKHASFSYGELSYFGGADSGSWHSPLEIDMQPYCGFSPEEFLSYDSYDDPEITTIQIRGVKGFVERYDSDWHYLTLWSGNSAIYIGTHKTTFDIEQAARDLIPIAEGRNAVLNPLPPPRTSSC